MTKTPKANQNPYLDWLRERVRERSHRRKYGDLCAWLHEQDFYGILPNDDNRCSDGEKLRDRFGIQLNKPCSMLEMLVGLAERMDYILFNGYDDRTDKWFWLFVENLGLDPVLTDENDRNYAIVKRFLERKYMANGFGGLFPLRHKNRDQRQVEIWYQMMAYIEEHHNT